MAAGAVVVRGIDARDAIEHFTRRGCADTLEFFTTDHITCAGVFENVGLLRGTQPVADHGGHTQLDRRASSIDRLQGEAVIAVGQGLQPGAFEQRIEALLGRVLTFQAAALQAAGDLRTIGNQHAGLSTELAQRSFKLAWRNVIRLGCHLGSLRHRQTADRKAGTENDMAQHTHQR